IVESALLPPALCGHPIINAGVGGATIGFFTRYASLSREIAIPHSSFYLFMGGLHRRILVVPQCGSPLRCSCSPHGEAERRTKAPCKGAELQRVGTAL